MLPREGEKRVVNPKVQGVHKWKIRGHQRERGESEKQERRGQRPLSDARGA